MGKGRELLGVSGKGRPVFEGDGPSVDGHNAQNWKGEDGNRGI